MYVKGTKNLLRKLCSIIINTFFLVSPDILLIYLSLSNELFQSFLNTVNKTTIKKIYIENLKLRYNIHITVRPFLSLKSSVVELLAHID